MYDILRLVYHILIVPVWFEGCSPLSGFYLLFPSLEFASSHCPSFVGNPCIFGMIFPYPLA